MGRGESTVRCAATTACAITWPPKTRPNGIGWLAPVKMSSLVRAPVSSSARVSSRMRMRSVMRVLSTVPGAGPL